MFENLFGESYLNAHHHWASADDFEFLYQGDMTVTKYYNRFMELAQYCMTGNINARTLILKFMSKLQQLIADKITENRFNILMDCYASAQLPEANIKDRNVEHARARNLWVARRWPSKGQVAGRH